MTDYRVLFVACVSLIFGYMLGRVSLWDMQKERHILLSTIIGIAMKNATVELCECGDEEEEKQS